MDTPIPARSFEHVVAVQDLSREKDYQDLRDLRGWSPRHKVAALLGHDFFKEDSIVAF